MEDTSMEDTAMEDIAQHSDKTQESRTSSPPPSQALSVQGKAEEEDDDDSSSSSSSSSELLHKNGSSSSSSVNGLSIQDDAEDDDETKEELKASSSNTLLNGAEERKNRRKSSLNVREEEELQIQDEPEEEEDVNDVEEVKEDEDSDVMELDAEDPLGTPTRKSGRGGSSSLVTIDDVKTLHRMAESSSKTGKRTSCSSSSASGKPNVVLIDTDSILAGKSNSGVTITPAAAKAALAASSTSFKSKSSSGFSCGVSISSSSSHHKDGGRPQGKGFASSNAATGDSKKEFHDRNLTDDTFVVEAPSFIVPYVYEKPPLETFAAFKAEVRKLMTEMTRKRRLERKKKKKDKNRDDPDYESANESEVEEDIKASDTDDDDDDSSGDLDIVEVKPERKSESFFDSALGTFFSGLGMSLVQEMVQSDLLKQQVRKSQKDKSPSVMQAILSLRKNLESSKEANTQYRFPLKKCKHCSFKTESALALANHLETPHMKMNFYRCNFCTFETKLPQEVLTHMMTEHGVRGKLERAPALHQCPQCPFEDNMKGKLTRHKTGCDKRFRPERNQEPSFDWEPPAKIPKPLALRGRPNPLLPYQSMQNSSVRSSSTLLNAKGHSNMYSNMPSLHMGGRGRGRPVGTYKGNQLMNPSRQHGFASGRQIVGGQFMNNQVVLQALNQRGSSNSSVLLPQLANSSSVTIQSLNQRPSKPGSPSISITPLPARSGNAVRPNAASSSLMKPGQPNSGQGRGNLVICEICDGFIKDLEQLRNHMQWIHKVKIHPKMIYNRPPLNCQKCQYRFFTDQGLERHLLGSHGLVTASMQDLANKGQDSGRCPVCGKVYQWKLLNHVAKDHQKTLKPAHLSYKCTVCTATFGQYKLFENHVYTAHSGAAKKADKSKQQQQQQQQQKSSILKTPVTSDEITVIPQKKRLAIDDPKSKVNPKNKTETSHQDNTKTTAKENDPDVIELDDEEEIDDVEDYSNDATDDKSEKASNNSPTVEEEDDGSSRKPAGAKTTTTTRRSAASGESEEPKPKKPRRDRSEEGVEEIEEEEEEEDQ